MNSPAINSTLSFNHSSSGSSLQLLSVYVGCRTPYRVYLIQYGVYVINAFMGYPANIMVIWLVARKETDSSTSDIFFVNLAIADAVYSLLVPLDYLTSAYIPLSIIIYIREFISGIKDTTPLFLTCICVDRYVAVVHPIVFISIKDNKIRVTISMLVWGLMMAYCYVRVWMGYFLGILFTGMILTISIIMVFCNFSIMWSLRKSVLGKEKMHPMKKKAFRTVQSTLAIIMFHYLPVAAILPFVYIYEFKGICVIQFIAFIIMDLSCSSEPLLFISRVKQLPFLNNLPCICCRSPSPEPHHVST